MNYLMAFALLLLSSPSAPPLLVLDINMKKPVHHATEFTSEQYLQRSFPVYANEAGAIIDAADQVVKLMDQEPLCHHVDTVATAHTRFLLTKSCEGGQNYSVMMLTTVDESQITFGVTLVKNETSRRKAQQKVLDMATYLAQ
jgi:hypothetical protein